MEIEELISPKKTAKMLGVCIVTLRNWEKNGKLECVRTLGGHRRYKLEEIKKILNKKDIAL